MEKSINFFQTKKEMLNACSDFLFNVILSNIKNNSFNLALSGGRTPSPLYKSLFSKLVKDKIDKKINIFLTDERCVPTTSRDSNYKMIKNCALETKFNGKIHQMFYEDLGPKESCNQYSKKIQNYKINAAVFGIGNDGHIASIFHNKDLKDKESLNVYEPINFDFTRISLTMKSILEINKIIVIASGIEKEKQIKNIIEDNSTVLNPLSFLFNNTNGSYFLSDMNVDI